MNHMSNSTTITGILCGNCKGRHATIDQVKSCHAVKIRHTAKTAAAYAKDDNDMARMEAAADVLEAAAVAAAKWDNEPTAPLPTAKKFERLPASHYVVTIDGVDKFYRVTWGKKGGKWEGYTFLEAQASDDHWPIKNKDAREAVFAAIREQGVMECIARYGLALGKCGICSKTLTDPDSIARGIGPVCLAGL